MLTIGKDWVHENINKEVDVNLFGQELNPQPTLFVNLIF
jgi:hypothetical protein